MIDNFIANDFKQAYWNTDLRPKLAPNEVVRRFYYERGMHSRLEALKVDIMLQGGDGKFLFSGHRGCGKSTELFKLIDNINSDSFTQEQFYIIQYSVYDVLDINNLDYRDILFSLLIQITKQLINLDLDDILKKRLADEVYDWLYEEIMPAEQETKAEDIPLLYTIISFVIRFGDKLKMESGSRNEFRKIVENKLSDLIGLINYLIDEIKKNINKFLLVIIDDLDKVFPDAGIKIFRDYGTLLTQPQCSIIYTIPISLRLSDDYPTIMRKFDGSYDVPMVKIREKDDTIVESQIKKLEGLISKRMSLELFDKDTLKALILLSGGVPRDLIRLVHQCSLTALTNKNETITLKLVGEAKNNFLRDYYSILDDEDYKILANIAATKRFLESDDRKKYLHNLCVLEYPNEKGWYDLHPIVKFLLEEWEKEKKLLIG